MADFAPDYLLPGNASPAERATNRSVLVRLPPEELRQSVEVDQYSAAAVTFWRANPGEADAYQTQDRVKESIRAHGGPWRLGHGRDARRVRSQVVNAADGW